MYSITFDYARHRLRDIPLIPVSLKGRQGWVEIWACPELRRRAYLDSGAFYSLFDDKVADLLGIELTRGRRMLAVVGDGSFIPLYQFCTEVKLGQDEFEMAIGFSAKLGVGFNLLGMDLFEGTRGQGYKGQGGVYPLLPVSESTSAPLLLDESIVRQYADH